MSECATFRADRLAHELRDPVTLWLLNEREAAPVGLPPPNPTSPPRARAVIVVVVARVGALVSVRVRVV